MKALQETGLIQDLVKSLGPVIGTRAPIQPVDPTKQYLVLTLLGGKAFLEQLVVPEGVGEHRRMLDSPISVSEP